MHPSFTTSKLQITHKILVLISSRYVDKVCEKCNTKKKKKGFLNLENCYIAFVTPALPLQLGLDIDLHNYIDLCREL